MVDGEREQGGPSPRSRWQAVVAFLGWLAERETLPQREPAVTARAPGGQIGLLGSVAALLSSPAQLPAPPPTAPAPTGPGFLAWLLAGEQLPTAPAPAPPRPGLLATLLAREQLPTAPEQSPTPPPAEPHRAAPDKE